MKKVFLISTLASIVMMIVSLVYIFINESIGCIYTFLVFSLIGLFSIFKLDKLEKLEMDNNL
jgi:hypothetical protein